MGIQGFHPDGYIFTEQQDMLYAIERLVYWCKEFGIEIDPAVGIFLEEIPAKPEYQLPIYWRAYAKDIHHEEKAEQDRQDMEEYERALAAGEIEEPENSTD